MNYLHWGSSSDLQLKIPTDQSKDFSKNEEKLQSLFFTTCNKTLADLIFQSLLWASVDSEQTNICGDVEGQNLHSLPVRSTVTNQSSPPDTFRNKLITNYTSPLHEPQHDAAPFVIVIVVVLKNGASVNSAKDAPGRWISSE